MGIIIKPVITEKTTALTEKTAERYVFRVSPDDQQDRDQEGHRGRCTM